jgi:hypothetical protein
LGRINTLLKDEGEPKNSASLLRVVEKLSSDIFLIRRSERILIDVCKACEKQMSSETETMSNEIKTRLLHSFATASLSGNLKVKVWNLYISLLDSLKDEVTSL